MGARNFITLLMIIFINLLAMIFLVFNIKANFMFELFLLVLFLLVGLIILTAVYKDLCWGYYVGMLYFSLSIINMIYVYFSSVRSLFIFFVSAVVNLIGLGICVGNVKYEEELVEEEPEEPEKEEITKDTKVVPYGKKAEKAIQKTFTPGVYVASKTATSYHSPKCDWAKKIKAKNRVWIKGHKEAKKKGYKKHSCLKK